MFVCFDHILKFTNLTFKTFSEAPSLLIHVVFFDVLLDTFLVHMLHRPSAQARAYEVLHNVCFLTKFALLLFLDFHGSLINFFIFMSVISSNRQCFFNGTQGLLFLLQQVSAWEDLKHLGVWSPLNWSLNY